MKFYPFEILSVSGHQLRPSAPRFSPLFSGLLGSILHRTRFFLIALSLPVGWAVLVPSALASSATVTEGQVVTFAVTASGTAPFNYQWYKSSAAIAGATDATYTINAVSMADADSYSTTVSNTAGSTTSDLAVLTVNAPLVAPSITTQPQSLSVTTGLSASFSVSVSGSSPLSYQWIKDGSAIAGATSTTYTLSNVTSSNAGNYVVVVSNPAGSAPSNPALLTVTAASVAPTLTLQPINQSAALGLSASFTVAASGSAPLAYQWRKNGANVVGANAATYTIASVTSADAASYSVVVTNSAGTAISNAATLTITGAAQPPMTIWPSATVPPVSIDAGADIPTELGVIFRSDVAGKINSVRFYKAAANTGTHVANLWSQSGQLLATATFRNETTSGWQQVNFSTPVSIAANTTYVASYHSKHGHYSMALNYFAGRSVDNAPLHVPADGAFGGNGVYIRCQGQSLFPNQTYLSSNYWVDVVFQPGQ